MKNSIILLILFTAIGILVSSCSAIQVFNPSPVPGSSASGSSSPLPSEPVKTSPQSPVDLYSLITEPADGISPVTSLIQKASQSIDLVMYSLEDESIEKALVSARNQRVMVRVLLNQGYYGQTSPANESAYQYLQSQGVAVRWTPAYFALTHQKTIIVDDNLALIMTFNFTPQYYNNDRNFGIIDKDLKDVSTIETTFNDDWQQVKDSPSMADNLVWSPGAETAILSLIRNSHKSLFIENGEMADSDVENALIAAAQRGVAVRVVMTYSSQWASDFQKLASGGVKVRTYPSSADLYIHAKMILVDGDKAFVGSQNFSRTSLEDNRELGIILTDPHILSSLGDTFQSDWNGGSTTP